MTSNNLKKKFSIDKEPVYMCFLKVTGVYKYKTNFIFNLCNNCVYKKYEDVNKINHEQNEKTKKYSTINVNLFKKNSIKFNKKRLNTVKIK